jgi:uncharacterized protein (DUF2062 family)
VLEQTNFFRRRVVGPILHLLRIGATPERLAWSIAMGLVIGVNPLLGSTTAVALVVASGFRLNVVASQFGNHLVYPMQWLMFPAFIRLGILLFHTEGLPLGHWAIVLAMKRHPWDTTRLLWSWEWHGLVVWAVFAALGAPLLKMALTPLLVGMLSRLHHEPIVEK